MSFSSFFYRLIFRIVLYSSNHTCCWVFTLHFVSHSLSLTLGCVSVCVCVFCVWPNTTACTVEWTFVTHAKRMCIHAHAQRSPALNLTVSSSSQLDLTKKKDKRGRRWHSFVFPTAFFWTPEGFIFYFHIFSFALDRRRWKRHKENVIADSRHKEVSERLCGPLTRFGFFLYYFLLGCCASPPSSCTVSLPTDTFHFIFCVEMSLYCEEAVRKRMQTEPRVVPWFNTKEAAGRDPTTPTPLPVPFIHCGSKVALNPFQVFFF